MPKYERFRPNVLLFFEFLSFIYIKQKFKEKTISWLKSLGILINICADDRIFARSLVIFFTPQPRFRVRDLLWVTFLLPAHYKMSIVFVAELRG